MSSQPAPLPDRLTQTSEGGLWVCQRRPISPGQRVRILGGASEVCLHMGIVGKPLEAELLPGGRAALLYRPGSPTTFCGPVSDVEAEILTDPSGQRYYWEPVQPRIEAGWQPRHPKREINRYQTDRPAEAQAWLADHLEDRAGTARMHAQLHGCTPPPCQVCDTDCPQDAAQALDDLAQAAHQWPPAGTQDWSQTAAGVTYHLRGRQP